MRKVLFSELDAWLGLTAAGRSGHGYYKHGKRLGKDTLIRPWVRVAKNRTAFLKRPVVPLVLQQLLVARLQTPGRQSFTIKHQPAPCILFLLGARRFLTSFLWQER